MATDAFERNKYSELDYVKNIISDAMIVSYGSISVIDSDSVVVTQAVSDTGAAERIRCTFMNLGSSVFSLAIRPAEGMRVVVLSPNRAVDGMYDSLEQIEKSHPKGYIDTTNASSYSSQHALCFPMVKATTQALSSLIIESDLVTAEIKTELVASLKDTVEIDLYGDSSIELHEETEHFRGCYGNMIQTFGMPQGINGTEKEGTYEYEETYGRYSLVKKNYESGAEITVGKSYETPFLDPKGALEDSAAPVNIVLGETAPVTLTFGDSVITIKADTTDGLDISLTGAAKVNILAADGKFNFTNKDGSLKGILDKICEVCATINTLGGPAAQTLAPDLIAKFSVGGEIPLLIGKVLE